MQTLITSWLSALLFTQPVHIAVNHTTVRLLKYQVRPASQEQFQNALNAYVVSTLKMQGNVMCEAYFEEADRSTLWIIERWSGKHFISKNDNTEAAKAIAALTKHALVSPVQITLMQDLEPLPDKAYHKTPDTVDRPFTIMLFVDAQPGTEDEFRKLYHTAMPAFRSEPGVITYQLSQSQTDKTKFVTYEKFRSEEAFQYHLNFPPIVPVLQYLRSSIKEQPFEKGLHRLIQFAPAYANK